MLWFQLEDMFQLIVTPQGIEKVMIQLKDTPSKVYAIGAELFLSKVPTLYCQTQTNIFVRKLADVGCLGWPEFLSPIFTALLGLI